VALAALPPSQFAREVNRHDTDTKLLRTNRKVRVMLLAFDFEVRDEDEGGRSGLDTVPLKPFDIVRNEIRAASMPWSAPRAMYCRHLGGAGRHHRRQPAGMSRTRRRASVLGGHPARREFNGDLAAMRAVVRDRIEEFEDNALCDDPEIEEFRPLLRKQLGLAAPSDPLQSLHRAVTQC